MDGYGVDTVYTPCGHPVRPTLERPLPVIRLPLRAVAALLPALAAAPAQASGVDVLVRVAGIASSEGEVGCAMTGAGPVPGVTGPWARRPW